MDCIHETVCMFACLALHEERERRLDLTKLGLKSFLTASALSNLLEEIAQQDSSFIPGACSQRTIKRARERAVDDTDSHFGPTLQECSVVMMDGSTEKICIASPATVLWESCRRCPKFREFFRARLLASPPSIQEPWDLIWYCDEVSPGNQLAPTNRRKLQAIYFSFKQFGPEYLCQERSWFVLTACRSIMVQNMDAGMSQLTRVAMQAFIHPFDFTNGIALPVDDDGSMRVLVSRVSVLVADEAALKSMVEHKGSAGKLICLLCRNAVQRRYAETLPANLIHHTCTDTTRFVMHSKASLLRCVQHLKEESGRLGTVAFADLQTSLGLNFFPLGLLSDDTLMSHFDIVKSFMYDWMHVYFVGGLYHRELNLLLPVLHRAGVPQRALQEFVATFQWPQWTGTKGATLHGLFKKGGEFKSSASEALAMYPVVRLFLQRLDSARVSDELRKARNSFYLLCEVLDCLSRAARGIASVTGVELHRAIVRHCRRYIDVYGEQEFPPKGHFALHLGAMLEHHGCLVSCWVHERRHKLLKRFANSLQNMQQGSEKGILEQAQLAHWNELQGAAISEVGLIDARPPSDALQAALNAHCGTFIACMVSLKAFYAPGRWCGRGDVVLLQKPDAVAEIWFHLECGHLVSCVSCYKKMEQNVFQITRSPEFVLTTRILFPCIFHRLPGKEKVLIAPQLLHVHER